MRLHLIYNNKEWVLFHDGLFAVDDINTLTRFLDSYTLEVVNDIVVRIPLDCLNAGRSCNMGFWTESSHRIGRTDRQPIKIGIDFNVV